MIILVLILTIEFVDRDDSLKVHFPIRVYEYTMNFALQVNGDDWHVLRFIYN